MCNCVLSVQRCTACSHVVPRLEWDGGGCFLVSNMSVFVIPFCVCDQSCDDRIKVLRTQPCPIWLSWNEGIQVPGLVAYKHCSYSPVHTTSSCSIGLRSFAASTFTCNCYGPTPTEARPRPEYPSPSPDTRRHDKSSLTTACTQRLCLPRAVQRSPTRPHTLSRP